MGLALEKNFSAIIGITQQVSYFTSSSLAQRSDPLPSPEVFSSGEEKLDHKGSSVSSNQYFKDMYELDDGKPTNNVQILAKRFLECGAKPNSEIINKVLKFETENAVSEEVLQELASIEPFDLGCVPIS